MKIGIDIRALGTKNMTGIGRYIFYAINNLLALDKENQYYLFSSGLNHKPYTDFNFSQDNVQHVHVNISNKLLKFKILTGINSNVCDRFFEGVDIFWMPHVNFCHLNKNCPSILTVHDLSFLHSREFYSLKKRYWHKLLNISRLVESADHIIAISENTKRDLVRFFPLEGNKISIIEPGVEYIEMNQEKADTLLEKFSLPDKFFIYVGTIEPRKNIESIIKAFDRYNKDYPDTHLVIVGDKGWIYNKILRKIQKRPFIHYLEYVDSSVKDALYFNSQGLIWPSFYEGYGFPPLEAISHNIPVIVSYKTSLPEVNKQQALYVDPYNVSDIYKALKSLREDKALTKQLENSSKNFVIPRWTEQSQKLLDLFNTYKK